MYQYSRTPGLRRQRLGIPVRPQQFPLEHVIELNSRQPQNNGLR